MTYAGAGARLSPEQGLELDPRRWGFQIKSDGEYADVCTDDAGIIVSIDARSGKPHDRAEVDGLLGLATGLPDAHLVGELEAGTEAGVRARAARGWTAIHLFDLARWRGADVAGEPYETRYSLLHRWQAAVECYGEVPRRDWWTLDDQGDAHDRATGRYVRPVPHDLRRLPILPLVRGRGAAAQLWREHVELAGGEGLVAVRLDAPLGAR